MLFVKQADNELSDSSDLGMGKVSSLQLKQEQSKLLNQPKSLYADGADAQMSMMQRFKA